MGKSNKKIKEQMIQLYGPECFIDKLHLRVDKEPRRYKSKKQYEKMKQLTYHHIKEKRNGGHTTIENGAILSAENHSWFNKQKPENQKAMNNAFQEYKKSINIAIMQGATIMEAQNLEIDMQDYIEIPVYDNKKYNRAKVKQEFQKKIKEELER